MHARCLTGLGDQVGKNVSLALITPYSVSPSGVASNGWGFRSDREQLFYQDRGTGKYELINKRKTNSVHG